MAARLHTPNLRDKTFLPGQQQERVTEGKTEPDSASAKGAPQDSLLAFKGRASTRANTRSRAKHRAQGEDEGVPPRLQPESHVSRQLAAPSKRIPCSLPLPIST